MITSAANIVGLNYLRLPDSLRIRTANCKYLEFVRRSPMD